MSEKLYLSYAEPDRPVVSALAGWMRRRMIQNVGHDRFPAPDTSRKSHLDGILSCSTVLCLVTENWLASPECGEDLIIAEFHDKHIIAILLDDIGTQHQASLAGPMHASVHRNDTLQRILGEHDVFDLSRAMVCRRFMTDLADRIAGPFLDAMSAGLIGPGWQYPGLEPWETDPLAMPNDWTAGETLSTDAF